MRVNKCNRDLSRVTIGIYTAHCCGFQTLIAARRWNMRTAAAWRCTHKAKDISRREISGALTEISRSRLSRSVSGFARPPSTGMNPQDSMQSFRPVTEWVQYSRCYGLALTGELFRARSEGNLLPRGLEVLASCQCPLVRCRERSCL